MKELILILPEMKDIDVVRFGVRTKEIPSIQPYVDERRGGVKVCNEQLQRSQIVCPTLPILD